MAPILPRHIAIRRWLWPVLLVLAAIPAFSVWDSKDTVSMRPRAITVFLAASTSEVLDEIARIYEERTGIPVKTNPASSGTLVHQLELGAEADIFISASREWMVFADELGLVSEHRPFMRNRLVLIAPNDTSMEPFELTRDSDIPSMFGGRLSIGDPAHVPAGAYAREALSYFGCFERLASRLQPAANVRDALSVVEMGEAELGIVYETDAVNSRKAAILARFPDDSHTPVEYLCARLTPEGGGFYEFLRSGEAAAAFERYGFVPSDPR